MKLAAFADPRARSPAPELDGDREQILRELGPEPVAGAAPA